MLKVQRLHKDAVLPTCAHPFEDCGYDIYSCADTWLNWGKPTQIRTGIAAKFDHPVDPYGLLIRDRSSMASKGLFTIGGVVDSGYTGEIIVILVDSLNRGEQYFIPKGTKIAQMIPIRVMTEHGVEEVDLLCESNRGEKGFGSTGN